MDSKDDDIFEDLDEVLPTSYKEILCQMIQGQALLEMAIAELIEVEFGMEFLETYIMLGRMDLRGRLDKLHSIYKARKDQNGAKMMATFKKEITPHVNTRNSVVHGYCFGHKMKDGEMVLMYSTSTAYMQTPKSEEAMVKVLFVRAQDVLMAARFFFALSQSLRKLAGERRQQLSEPPTAG